MALEEAAPGVWRIVLGLEDETLSVNVYILKDPDGRFVLVDSGWRNLECVGQIDDALKTLGGSLDDVAQLAVTHGHPDHAGLAGDLQKETGCEVFLHKADEFMLSRYRTPQRMEEWRRYMEDHGMPSEEVMGAVHTQWSSMTSRWGEDDRPATDVSQTPDAIDSVGLEAVYTPGHSPGHECFWMPSDAVLFSGDHVLPHITPNVSVHPNTEGNPLGAYLESLDRVLELPARRVLPAHGEPFDDLKGRIDEILVHHHERMSEVLGALDGGPRSAFEVASHVTWKTGAFEDLPYFHQRMAVGETLAHLRQLVAERKANEARRHDGGIRFSLRD
jgi:glyoxylase-like metal-dependent hydrolase (beta-lactamase superfamily II)